MYKCDFICLWLLAASLWPRETAADSHRPPVISRDHCHPCEAFFLEGEGGTQSVTDEGAAPSLNTFYCTFLIFKVRFMKR